jgi:hypothetical protein
MASNAHKTSGSWWDIPMMFGIVFGAPITIVLTYQWFGVAGLVILGIVAVSFIAIVAQPKSKPAARPEEPTRVGVQKAKDADLAARLKRR